MSRPMPGPTDFKTLVDVEMGFLYLKLKLRLKNSTQNGNMKNQSGYEPLNLENGSFVNS